MYLVKIYDGPDDNTGTVIHSPYTDNIKLSKGTVNEVINSVDDFSFAFNLQNPAWENIKPLKTLTEVVDTKRDKRIFRGRVLKPKNSMDGSGHFTRSYDAESILAYLRDSSQRHEEIHDTTIKDFFKLIIENHNKQVEPHKRFKVGKVTVTNTTDNVYRYLGYDTTFETIKDKLLDRLGGYLVVREEDGVNYIDYLEEIGEDKDDTPIRIAHNMKSMSQEVDPTKVITRLIPLGERIESDNEEDTDASEARLTIEDENDGKDYLDDEDLQEEFGVIEGTETWDDVTSADRLKFKGEEFLRQQKAANVSFTVDSLNVDLLEKDVDSFEVGNRHPLINPVLAVDEKIQVIEKNTDLKTPEKSSLKFGDKEKTLSQYQQESNKSTQRITNLQSTVDRQSKTIGTLKTDIDTVNQSIGDIREKLGDADIPGLDDAVQHLQKAVEDLQSTVKDIPTETATHDSDGLMSSEDKERLDGLEHYDEATDEDKGLMSSNDKKKLDYIEVDESIDLVKLAQDVKDLKEKDDE